MPSREFCGKIPYETAFEAERALRRVKSGSTKGRSRKAQRANNKRSGRFKGQGAKMSAYKCAICGNWHWGHRT